MTITIGAIFWTASVILNPLRAGLVPDLQTLEDYPWCGHAGLLGTRPTVGVSTDAILSLFGKKQKSARYAYQNFVADGLKMGKRQELFGGGLRRSMVNVQGVAESLKTTASFRRGDY